jgi:hypothetical protein
MRLSRAGVLVTAFVLAGAAVAVAQTADDSHDILISIAGVATLELNDTTQITLSTSAPTAGNAGTAVAGSTNATKRLFYTLLTSGTQTIQASHGVTGPPAGTSIGLAASNVLAGNGTAVGGGVTLSGTPQDIITGIGSTATTRVLADVPLLTYTLQIDTPAALTIGDTTITVTLTLTGP